jgi:signal transduction histidine kinase
MGTHRLRLRLTLLYCVMSVASGALLLVIMYGLANRLPDDAQPFEGNVDPFRDPPAVPRPIFVPVRAAEIDLVLPTIALGILAVISLVLGWLIAGRMLRPVRTMTERLQQISERNVHERLSLTGPRDELKNLADTVDGLLGRLEVALAAHKRFVANAAHELRTPLTVEHALLEEPLIDPDADAASFRANFERLLVINDQRARLLESLLTLSGSEYGRDLSEPVDLDALVERVLRDRQPEIERRGLHVETSILPARIVGDAALVERLVANLCDNAIHYNLPDGRIDVRVRARGDSAMLRVTNTGPPVPPEQVDRLFEPFQRLHRTVDDDHHGLGLSIVRAIASAHGGTISAEPQRKGGLLVEVTFAGSPST